MCIICEQGKHLVTLQQVLWRLEGDGRKDTKTYNYVKQEFDKLKATIDKEEAMFQRAKETLEELLTETVFYPVVDDEKQAHKN